MQSNRMLYNQSVSSEGVSVWSLPLVGLGILVPFVRLSSPRLGAKAAIRILLLPIPGYCQVLCRRRICIVTFGTRSFLTRQ